MRADFDRQSFLGEDSERILGACRVGIVGLGGGGSHVVQQLAHVGVGNFLLIDHDHIESTNLNRLVGATALDVDQQRQKVYIADRVARAVNPEAEVVCQPMEWPRCARLLRDRHVVFGCLDDMRPRLELEAACRRYHIPYIDIGMTVSSTAQGFRISGQIVVSVPGGLCLRCYGFRAAPVEPRYGNAGGNPQVVWSNGLLASAAVGAFVQLVTPWHPGLTTHYLEYDGNGQELRRSDFDGLLPGTCVHYPPQEIGDPSVHEP